jgi:hypothetical protein
MGKMNCKIYRMNPHTKEELKERQRDFGSSSGKTPLGKFQPI